MACVLQNSGPQPSGVSLVSGKSLKKGYSALLELLAERLFFLPNMKDQSEKKTETA